MGPGDAGALRAAELDRQDELASFRARFALPARVYLCGQSLGPQPDVARAAVLHHLGKWATQGVDGHFAGLDDCEAWASLEDAASGAAGCALVGARPGEIVYMNSLTVNLQLLLVAFYEPQIKQGRVEVLLEDHAFPSDDYAVQTHVESRGVNPSEAIVRLRPRNGEEILREEDIIREITTRAKAGTLALVLLPGVQYFTGQVLPISSIAETCRSAGVPLGLDLAHAVGNIPLRLHDWKVDFAVWCSYKYLNSGPGAVAGAFIHSMHGDCLERRRLGGWWGHERSTRFEMTSKFVPQAGVRGFQISNPSVLSLAPVIASLKLFEAAGGMEKLRRKSMKLTAFLEERLSDELGDQIEIITPTDSKCRGCQLSIRLRGEKIRVHTVQSQLVDRGVVCDVREPNTLRVAAAPLYNSFTDAHEFVSALKAVLEGTATQ